MISYRGYGGLTILIGIVTVLLEIVARAFPWLLVAAAINFALGWFVNRSFREQNVAPEQQHSVAEIPMQWWSILFVVAQLFVGWGR